MKKSDITREQGLKAVVEGTVFDDKWVITKFDVVLVRAGNNAIEKPNMGNAFSSDVQQLLAKLKPGDQLIMQDIKAKLVNAPGAPERDLANLTLKVLPN